MMKGDSKKTMVRGMFDDIAPTYDALNHILSLGIDRCWRRRVVGLASARFTKTGISPQDPPPEKSRAGNPSAISRPPAILDVATGTGDLAIALARKIPAATVTGVDISEGMLAEGREKVRHKGLSGRISLQTGDAESLDFAAGSIEVVTAAFGVRNFGDIPAGLREMQRVLTPGGRCFVLEFSEPSVPVLGAVYRFYFHRILPWMGRIVSRDASAYTYLPRSVGAFPSPERFCAMLRQAGFSVVTKHRLSLGIAYIYECEK